MRRLDEPDDPRPFDINTFLRPLQVISAALLLVLFAELFSVSSSRFDLESRLNWQGQIPMQAQVHFLPAGIRDRLQTELKAWRLQPDKDQLPKFRQMDPAVLRSLLQGAFTEEELIERRRP